jgi:putative peptidoglycan lipid II flippase
VLFTVHYLLLRGFYADEDTRTPFLVQIGLAATNIGAALAYTQGAPPDRIAMLLALAYGTAYLVGSSPRHRAVAPARDDLRTPDAGVPAAADRSDRRRCGRDAGRLLVPAGAGPQAEGPLPSLVLASTAGLAGALVYVLAAWAVRLREVGSLIGAVTGRLR